MEEKSLGCIRKEGTRPIVEVLPETARPTKQGEIIMDTPGYDIASVTSMVAGGGAVLLCLPQAGEHQRVMRWHQFLK